MCADPKIFNDPIFGWLYNNSRNFKVWVAFLVQYLKMFPKKYRRQLSHVFFFAISSISDIKEIWIDYGGVFDNFSDFRRAFAMATEKGGTLVVNVSVQSSKIEEKV